MAQNVEPVPVSRTGEPAPLGTLLTSVRDRGGEWSRWADGITWSSWCPAVRSAPFCHDHSADPKLPAAGRTTVTVEPATLYLWSECDLPTDTAARVAETEAHLADQTSAQLARLVQQGTTDHGATDNPSLQSSAVPASIDVLAPDIAIGGLLKHREQCPGRTVLHVPVELLPFLLAYNLAAPQGDVLVGPAGSLVIADPGYDADVTPSDPELEPEPLPATEGQAWIYASGPLELAVADLETRDSADEGFGMRRNRHEAMAERIGLVRFEPCCVFAALVEVPTVCCDPGVVVS